MTSIYARLTQQQEEQGKMWQTKSLKASSHALTGFCNVVAVLRQNYLTPDHWQAWLNKGSVTFQESANRRMVVRVFIDDGNWLAKRYGYSLPPDPIVIGFDLTGRAPFERHLIRENLRSRSKYYADPEAGHEKIKISPDGRHWHDLLFLPPGPCEEPANESLIVEIRQLIEQREPSSNERIPLNNIENSSPTQK